MSQSDATKIEELHAVVSGYVQGVGFRYFVVQKAQTLGLRGYVRNQENGAVEVVAQGTRPALERLLSLLRQGPAASDVRNVQTAWQEPATYIGGFHIRY